MGFKAHSVKEPVGTPVLLDDVGETTLVVGAIGPSTAGVTVLTPPAQAAVVGETPVIVPPVEGSSTATFAAPGPA